MKPNRLDMRLPGGDGMIMYPGSAKEPSAWIDSTSSEVNREGLVVQEQDQGKAQRPYLVVEGLLVVKHYTLLEHEPGDTT